MNFNCETCTDVFVEEVITLTKRNKVSNNGQSLSVKATISPSYVSNKKVSWSVAWKTTNSQNINNYITLSISSDTLTCNVSVKSAFSKQIILTCTSQSNSSVKATCTIDYVGRNLETYSDCTSARYYIDNYDLTFDGLFDMAIDNLETNITTGGTLKGTAKNIRVDYDGEFEFDSGYIFYIEDSSSCISEYDSDVHYFFMNDDLVFMPVIYDLYYGSTLVQKDVYKSIEMILA